ncbi:unnamed protein product, partial [Mesorhabditis belari]|uniref:Uncharacterized protein n=1 Tax=Mesorhabditis belari TaxID=2138241 RepID=A0AAF3FGQ2_9BILA
MRLFTSLLFGSIIGVSFSLDCFHCKDCDRETALVKECHSSTSQCYSILGPITRRGCAHKCPYNSAISEEECHLCSDDLCNHHQQGHFLQKSINHRGNRHRRDEAGRKVVASTHYHQDGTKIERYEDPNLSIPSLPQPQLPELPSADETENIIQMNADDPLFGKVDANGVAYLPVDPKTKEVLPEYRHLLEQYEKKENDGLPNTLNVEETEIQADNGDKIFEVKTDNVVYPPGTDKEDVVDEGQILGAGIGMALSKDDDENESFQPPALPVIPEGQMAEEDAMKLADQYEKAAEAAENEGNGNEEKTKDINEEQKPDIGHGAVPTESPKPDSAPTKSILSIVFLSIIFPLFL